MLSLLALLVQQPVLQAATPPVVTQRIEDDSRAFSVKIRPGVVQPGETVRVVIEVSDKLAQAHPVYGSRKPVETASVRAFLFNAPAVGSKPKTPTWPTWPTWIEGRLAVALPDAGSYGVSFTPSSTGAHTLLVQGTADGKGFGFSVLVAVGQWPIALGTAVAAAPAKLPEPQSANLAAGKALCAQHCKQDIETAFPHGAPPAWLSAPTGLLTEDGALLELLAGASATSLDAIQQHELLAYLRTLHTNLRELFPQAAALLAQELTISEHGQKRLKEVGAAVDEKTARGTVLVPYAGPPGPVRLISGGDLVGRDELDPKARLGFLLFFELDDDQEPVELTLALGREPTYPILAASARNRLGHDAAALNKDLKTFVGSGRFNDPKSLRGSARLSNVLLPLYLRAAELATTYYAEERELTAFDGAFE